jgi:hypothetical protein
MGLGHGKGRYRNWAMCHYLAGMAGIEIADLVVATNLLSKVALKPMKTTKLIPSSPSQHFQSQASPRDAVQGTIYDDAVVPHA